jgi:nucleoside-diphosphate-sugar epimerase
VPRLERLRFKAVHTDDVAQAYRRAALDDDARGPFNIAADPVIDPDELGRILGARPVPVDPRIMRALVDVTWRAHLQPTPPGWLDMALAVPLMDIGRARNALGWAPARTADDTLLELLDGMRRGDGAPAPPLIPGGAGLLRLRELAGGVGRRL